jgi:hypothetical protein
MKIFRTIKWKTVVLLLLLVVGIVILTLYFTWRFGACAGIVTVAGVSLNTTWSFFLLGPVGVVSTLCVGYVSSLFMHPPSEEHLLGLCMEKRITALATVQRVVGVGD